MYYRQCIFSAFGGKVEFAGEILHGKTSTIKHDGRGIYKNVSQDIAVTRYHSLAGTHTTLPADLEVTSWTESGVIQGVRHKKYIIEGVQYHPESILTEEGRMLFRNFLLMEGGEWKNEDTLPSPTGSTFPIPGKSKQESILDKIYAHRRATVEAQKLIPGSRPADLERLYALSLAPPQIDFPSRVRAVSTKCALMAEIKRASPSKGLIDIEASAPAQARTYALAGAAAISVLTEPEWFKGSIDDLRAARQAVEGMPNRPAILRKEFIFDEYQILEARLAGADTVLLIVKMLSDELLTRLYNYSLHTLGMEPLVEVNSREEMTRALKLGAKVIGVNNRDLHSFNVDLSTTSGLVDMIDPSTITLAALSGISTRDDVARYESANVGAVLVGESLMRAGSNVTTFIRELLNDTTPSITSSSDEILVKICGTRSVEAATIAAESGADLIGMILVPGAKRSPDDATQKAISAVVHSTPKGAGSDSTSVSVSPHKSTTWFQHGIRTLVTHPSRSLLVGVFMDQPLSFVLSKTRELDLDVVQLHGSEPVEWARLIPVPVIKRFKPKDVKKAGVAGYHAAVLLDPGAGEGGRLELEEVKRFLEGVGEGVPILLAGGLSYRNVGEVVELKDLGVVGVDVSSGVETEGRQDLVKVRRFVYQAKGREGV